MEGGVLPDDLKRKDVKLEYGDLAPQRNGRMDIFYGRGAMDYRLRMTEAIAGLDRFAVHDAPFWGSFRGGGLGNMGLGNNVPWQRYPEFDLLLFTGIPYAAIGIENCYGMVPYVKAGGAVFFTGGEWAFGKGGYLMTVLERELLPVLCTEMKDSRTSDKPVMMEPGKDFTELSCKADFAAKPSFWVYNQVLLKDAPGVKVFLTSSKGPVLAGWQVGKGRVACLLVDHRGKSANGVTAFFDWADWPGLVRSVFTWLAPEAGQVGPARASVSAAEAKKLTELLEQDALGELGGNVGGKEADEARIAALRRLLSAPASAIDTTIVLDQLMTGRLPDDVRWAAMDCVLARPPATLAERVRNGLKHQDASVRQTALQCLGAVDVTALLRELNNPSQTPEPDSAGRMYALTLTLPLVKTAALVANGRLRVRQWNASEKEVLEKWTDGKGFSAAAPELPGLDGKSLVQRVAWLAYLSRHDPRTFGAQFAPVADDGGVSGILQAHDRQPQGGRLVRLSACFGRLRELTRPDVEALLKAEPGTIAAGFGRAHFTREIQAAMNLLGDQDRARRRESWRSSGWRPIPIWPPLPPHAWTKPKSNWMRSYGDFRGPCAGPASSPPCERDRSGESHGAPPFRADVPGPSPLGHRTAPACDRQIGRSGSDPWQRSRRRLRHWRKPPLLGSQAPRGMGHRFCATRHRAGQGESSPAIDRRSFHHEERLGTRQARRAVRHRDRLRAVPHLCR